MAQILNGKALADNLKTEIKKEVLTLQEKGVQPRLDTILAGEDPGSSYYAQIKKKVAASLGIHFELHRLPANVTESTIAQLITKLGGDLGVHGIMVELPLPKHLCQPSLLQLIPPFKDVDGVHPENRGHLMSGEVGLYPATPLSCLEILRNYNIQVRGAYAVIVGRGETVGKPLALLLIQADATVTVCHTKTLDLASYTRQADIIISAAGKEKLIQASMVKQGAVILDAGTNPSANGGICGDVDYEAVAPLAAAITPVPGGVGSMTTALLMKNLLLALKLQKERMETP